MKIKYAKYISEECLGHCRHSFDTQVNKGMKNSIVTYAGKEKHHSGTSSLLTCVLVAAGVQLVGYHHFWTSVLNLLQVKIPHQLHLHCLVVDKEEAVLFHCNHKFKIKSTR